MNATRMTPAEATDCMRRVLAATGAGERGLLGPGDPAMLASLPAGIARFAVFAAGGEHWVVAARDASAGEVRGQVVLSLGPGRYLVETFDAVTGQCLARESAAGGPVVAGLVCAATLVALRIRRVADASVQAGDCGDSE